MYLRENNSRQRTASTKEWQEFVCMAGAERVWGAEMKPRRVCACLRACMYLCVWGGIQDLKTFGRLWFERRGKWGATSVS